MTEHRPPAPGGGDTPTATSLTLLDRVRAADPDAGRRPVHLYRALRRLRQEMVGLVEA